MTDSVLPVLAGLAVGVTFIVLFAMALRPDNVLSDEELIAKYSKLAQISYFLEKHPDARAEVERLSSEQALLVSYRVERQVEPASDLYTGINILSVSAYKDELNHVTLSVDCGVSQGLTAGITFRTGVSFDEISAIDAWEERCFPTSDNNLGLTYPDATGDELNDDVYQFAFKP